jgi:recombination protein RecA
MSDNKEKLKALQLTIDKLDKTYGKGTVMKLSDERVIDIPAISTGSLGLDIAWELAVFQEAGLSKYMAPSLQAKPHLRCTALQKHKKMADLAAFIDAEHAFDKKYAENLGLTQKIY